MSNYKSQTLNFLVMYKKTLQYIKDNITPQKKLGQHFLINNTIASKILDNININSESLIIEIGTGLGIITSHLLKTKLSNIYSIEIDESLAKHLIYLKKDKRLKIVFQNALKVQEEKIFPKKCIIIGNLPYNISTVLIIKWLKKIHLFEEILITVQEEVAKKLTARHDTKSYGRLSVITQTLCKTQILFNIAAENFYPKPKVNSSVIKITPKIDVTTKTTIQNIENVTKKLFSHRRKNLNNIIKQNFKNNVNIRNIIKHKIKLRPENLSIDEIHEITRSLNNSQY